MCKFVAAGNDPGRRALKDEVCRAVESAFRSRAGTHDDIENVVAGVIAELLSAPPFVL
jgi:hypothetical protein